MYQNSRVKHKGQKRPQQKTWWLYAFLTFQRKQSPSLLPPQPLPSSASCLSTLPCLPSLSDSVGRGKSLPGPCRLLTTPCPSVWSLQVQDCLLVFWNNPSNSFYTFCSCSINHLRSPWVSQGNFHNPPKIRPTTGSVLVPLNHTSPDFSAPKLRSKSL